MDRDHALICVLGPAFVFNEGNGLRIFVFWLRVFTALFAIVLDYESLVKT